MISYPRLLDIRVPLAGPLTYDHEEARAEAEERAVLHLARQAQRSGGQFAGWPRFRVSSDPTFDLQILEAEVWVIPR